MQFSNYLIEGQALGAGAGGTEGGGAVVTGFGACYRHF